MASTYRAPAFQFEENRLIYSLRLMAYPGDDFTSEQSVRCAYAVVAARAGERAPPAHEKNLDEWNRVLDALLGAEPRAWVQAGWTKLVTDERVEEAERLAEADRRATQH